MKGISFSISAKTKIAALSSVFAFFLVLGVTFKWYAHCINLRIQEATSSEDTIINRWPDYCTGGRWDPVIPSALADVVIIASGAALGALISVDLYNRTKKQNGDTQGGRPCTFRASGPGWRFEASCTDVEWSSCTKSSCKPPAKDDDSSETDTDHKPPSDKQDE